MTSGKELIPRSTRAETAIDIASFVTSAIPWIGGPVSNVLSGASLGRKLGRVREVLQGLVSELRDFKSSASEAYVQTEEFEDVLEKTLRQVADERHGEKRRAYRAFLTDAVTSPGEPYDEKIRVLRILEALQPDHLRVMKAFLAPAGDVHGVGGSPAQTLARRIPELSRDRIEDLVEQLNGMRLTRMTSMRTMMTSRGAENLQHAITPFGRRLLQFILATD